MGLWGSSVDNKAKIVRAIAELTDRRSLEEIKTVEICELAGVSRQTFYRCFRDKYDAAIWFVEEGVKSSVRQIGITLSWKTGNARLFEFMARNRSLFRSIFETRTMKSLGREAIERELESNMIRHYEEQCQQATGKPPDRLLRFQIHAFVVLSIVLLREWLQSDEVDLSDEFFESFVTLVPKKLFATLDIPDDVRRTPPTIML